MSERSSHPRRQAVVILSDVEDLNYAVAEGMFRFVGDGSRVLLSLVSLVLLLVPLVGILFGTAYSFRWPTR